ncbi:MAG: hypothetical protein WCN95_13150 [bacterium]
MTSLSAYRPAVSSRILVLLAGLLWVVVGAMLLVLAFSWLSEVSHLKRYASLAAGVVVALLMHHFVFLKIVDRNLARISSGDGKRCLFSFMPWKSYLMIPLMAGMGIVLRHSSIPKPFLAIVYVTIGLALILSSVRYVRVFFKSL